MKNDILVKDIIGIIPSKLSEERKLILKDIDDKENKQYFCNLAEFEFSGLYSKISDYEVYEINYKEDNNITIVYGTPINNKIELTRDELVTLKDILLDVKQATPNKNINRNILLNINSILEKVNNELYFYEDDL